MILTVNNLPNELRGKVLRYNREIDEAIEEAREQYARGEISQETFDLFYYLMPDPSGFTKYDTITEKLD